MPAHKTLQSNDSTELPYLKRIFDDLRRGKHLAEGDGPHVHALREGTEVYARLFDAQDVAAIVITPWILLPAIPVIIAILAFNFVGDGLRDAADPYGV